MTVQVYLCWDGMTPRDRALQEHQSTGTECGRAGFLHDFNRPNYTGILVDEGYRSPMVRIPSGELRSRVPRTVARILSWSDTYGQNDGSLDHYITMVTSFVERVAILELEGKDPRIRVSW